MQFNDSGIDGDFIANVSTVFLVLTVAKVVIGIFYDKLTCHIIVVICLIMI